jgi:hypothetical protein
MLYGFAGLYIQLPRFTNSLRIALNFFGHPYNAEPSHPPGSIFADQTPLPAEFFPHNCIRSIRSPGDVQGLTMNGKPARVVETSTAFHQEEVRTSQNEEGSVPCSRFILRKNYRARITIEIFWPE